MELDFIKLLSDVGIGLASFLAFVYVSVVRIGKLEQKVEGGLAELIAVNRDVLEELRLSRGVSEGLAEKKIKNGVSRLEVTHGHD